MSENRSGEEPTETFDREALAADARELVGALEAIHPDPYRGYEGRVELHAKLERVVRDLPESATAEEFYRRAAPLVAGMEDAHSLLHPPDHEDTANGNEGDRRLPVSFRVVGDRIYVESVSDDALTDLLGARLLAVGGTSVAALADRAAALRGAENQYTALLFAGGMVENHAPLARLLDRSAPPAEPTIRVEVDGEERLVALTPVAGDREPSHELVETFPHPTGTGPRYRLYEGGDAAVFVPGDLTGYRESFEASMDREAARAADLAPAAYDRNVGGDRPDDLTETVAVLPSMIETVTDLADDMAAADTKTLIVDIRDNTDGDSQFVFHIAYVLHSVGRKSLRDGIHRIERQRSGPVTCSGNCLRPTLSGVGGCRPHGRFILSDRGVPQTQLEYPSADRWYIRVRCSRTSVRQYQSVRSRAEPSLTASATGLVPRASGPPMATRLDTISATFSTSPEARTMGLILSDRAVSQIQLEYPSAVR